MPREVLEDRIVSQSSFSQNHEKGLSLWVFLLRDAARKERPFIPLEELKALIPNDSRDTSLSLLKLMTKTVMTQRRLAINPNYYLAGEKGQEKLLAGFELGEGRISAPAPHNLSSRHTIAPFVFEIWKEIPTETGVKIKPIEKIIVTIIKGKLEIIGNSTKLLSFLS